MTAVAEKARACALWTTPVAEAAALPIGSFEFYETLGTGIVVGGEAAAAEVAGLAAAGVTGADALRVQLASTRRSAGGKKTRFDHVTIQTNQDVFEVRFNGPLLELHRDVTADPRTSGSIVYALTEDAAGRFVSGHKYFLMNSLAHAPMVKYAWDLPSTHLLAIGVKSILESGSLTPFAVESLLDIPLFAAPPGTVAHSLPNNGAGRGIPRGQPNALARLPTAPPQRELRDGVWPVKA
jgi:hypothetical protein